MSAENTTRVEDIYLTSRRVQDIVDVLADHSVDDSKTRDLGGDITLLVCHCGQEFHHDGDMSKSATKQELFWLHTAEMLDKHIK